MTLLAPFTTFKIGGPARVFIKTNTDEGIEKAIKNARDLNLELYPIGDGSNILIPDEGVDGVVVKNTSKKIKVQNDGDDFLIIADSGALWEKIVNTANENNIFGIENLAGIPGTAGGAVVQNIGAYGAELSNVFEYADVIDMKTCEYKRIDKKNAMFEYRGSFFKKNPNYFITRIALRFRKNQKPDFSYPDLKNLVSSGSPMTKPNEISNAVRKIRSQKFPDLKEEGTAGSFFKNPIISRELADSLALKFPDLPLFPQKNGLIKIPLAWILDHVLSLNGYEKGLVRLYEKQPLVIVAKRGATAKDVDSFANEISERILSTTGIEVEREVETFGTRKRI